MVDDCQLTWNLHNDMSSAKPRLSYPDIIIRSSGLHYHVSSYPTLCTIKVLPFSPG